MSEVPMKRCIDEAHEGPRYLPVTEFHKQGKRRGKQSYNSRCKACKNRQYRQQYAQKNDGYSTEQEIKKRKAYSRARSRAMTRLSYMVPELYATILSEELEREDTEFMGVGRAANSLHRPKRKRR